jgi:protease-4
MSNTWEQKLIEEVVLSHVTEQRRRRRWGLFFKGTFLFLILASIVYNFWIDRMASSKQPHTALINIQGVISAEEGVNADEIMSSLRQAFEEPRVKGVILRINSPGGSPVQAGYVYDEIMRLKALYPNKKVYAVIADLGASAAYYIASAADMIYADKASIVGSIGVIMPNYGFVEVMKKLGVEQRTLTSGIHKNILDPMSPIDVDEKRFVENTLKVVHHQFINAVKNGRGDRLQDDPKLFTGLFWTGEQALPLGLIDGLGSAGFVAREIIKVQDLYDYTEEASFVDKLSKRLGAKMKGQIHQWLHLSWE